MIRGENRPYCNKSLNHEVRLDPKLVMHYQEDHNVGLDLHLTKSSRKWPPSGWLERQEFDDTPEKVTLRLWPLNGS